MKEEKTRVEISIIVPCYEEELAIPLFYEEIKKVLEEMPYSYEILFIDDGSRDGTLSVMENIAREDSHVHYISFSRNFGKEAAMYARFCNSVGQYVAVMDVDLQDPPLFAPNDADGSEWVV